MNPSSPTPGSNAVPPPPVTRRLFLRFAALAGAGWLFDAALLLTLVALGSEARVANVVSSCSAALAVFLVARQRLFRRAERHLPTRIAAYLGYTLCLIGVASLAVGWVVGRLEPWLAAHGAAPHAGFAAAAVAKVVVTPPQLMLNFLVSRFVSERRRAPHA